MKEKARALYEKKKFRIAIYGLIIAFIAAIANTTFQNFNVAASGQIEGGFAGTLLASYVLSVLLLGICELLGGIIMIVFNMCRGITLKEYGRMLGVRSSRTILLSSVMGGPIGTACAVLSIAMCGSTYSNCVIGLTPAITAIMGRLILKENVNKRVWIGIAICTAGVIIACLAPPEGITNFYLGIIIACICPIAYSLENMISTHAVDVSDPMVATPLYRMIGSALIEFTIVIIVCAVTGHMTWIGLALTLITSSPMCMVFMVCTAVFMTIQYNGTYYSYTNCGAVKASAILWTGTFWTIPIGFLMAAMNILDYNVTMVGILGAITVVIGIMLVVAKPSELFNLRNAE